jgi:DNA-binding Lrp family transcriptional regulator
MDKKEQILKAFVDAGKAVKQAEIAEKTGIEQKEVAKLVKQLVSDGKVYSPKVCFYQVK